MPSLLVDEAKGALPTVTLNTKDYYRVVGRTEESAAKVSSSLQVPRPKTQGPETSWKATWKWKVALERCLPKEAAAFDDATQLWRDGQVGHNHIKRQCIANLEVIARACDDPVRIKLIEWCQSLLEAKRRPYRQGFAPYTVRQRLMALFGGVFGGLMPPSLADLSSDHVLRTAIKKIGDEKSNLRRRLIDQAAKDFSNFLCGKEPGALDPDEEALAAEGGGEISKLEKIEGSLGLPDLSRERSRVSANLLSFREYRDVLEAAYKEDASGELALIIILAFRAGLRLREILGLQTSDILTYGDLSPEIHLRHNAFRNLKTHHSRRIIPLRSFLDQTEADRLLAWLEMRKVMAGKSDDVGLLFGDLWARSLPDEKVYEQKIEHILAKSCSDRLTFSHLRHSFGSYLLLTMLLPSAASEKLIPRHMRQLVSWKRKWSLLQTLVGKDRMGQSALHAVSQLMGHTGILRTLESYQHLLSLAVALYTNRQLTLPHFPPQVISRLWPQEREDAPPQALGPTAYWERVAGSLKQLPPLVESHQPLLAPTNFEKGAFEFRISSIKPLPRTALKSENSSRIGWRLLLELVKGTKAAADEQAALLGLSGSFVARIRRNYKQVTQSAFKPGALPAGLTAPRGRQAELILDHIWKLLPTKLSVHERRLLADFLNNFRPSRYNGVFAELSDATAFAALLRKMGFPGDHIFIAAGLADQIQRYKSDPSSLVPEVKGEETLYRRPADLQEMVTASLGTGQRRHAVVLWFRYVKFERDAMGLSFDTRYRLDAAQSRHDRKLRAAGQELSPARLRAEERREERSARDAARLHSTVLPAGNKAYRVSLLLAAVIYGIRLKVKFPDAAPSEDLRKLARVARSLTKTD